MDRLGGAFGTHEPDSFLDDTVEDDSTDLPPSPVGQDERRMQVRAYNHWASLLVDDALPLISELNPEELEDFSAHSVLLDFSTGIENPAIRYVGAELREECEAEGRIEWLTDVPPRSLLSRITDHYMQILANKAPIGFEAEFITHRGTTSLYRGILLPYSSDGEAINFMYGVINWKELADVETADALLLEIDQSLERELHASTQKRSTSKTSPVSRASKRGGPAQPNVLPSPSFGQPPRPSLPVERVDALGNPLGEFGGEDDGYELSDFNECDEDSFGSAMETAADYGLHDWDEEPEGEEVDDLVDPLASEDIAKSLISLVNRGARSKRTVELNARRATTSIAQPQIDTVQNAAEEDVHSGAQAETVETADQPELSAPDIAEAAEDASRIAAAAHSAPEGLYDCLAAARELAQTAQNTEDRSRKALYAAVGLAYDFSLEAQRAPDDFQEIIQDNGLSVQDRAPMTPIVKLVFGAEYDKTRLTEYAAVLTHAHRLNVKRGKLVDFLRGAEGGLKGVVQAERRARKEEQGKPVEDNDKGIRPALAQKLRSVETSDFAQLPEHGAEFALIMVRRTENGDLVVVGEIDEDRPLLEKAARKLLAK